jgi:2-oxoglutarate ferredoxin oxidoreductase subunit gamma
MTQNYGPESRGGACSAQVIVADMPVSYPHLTQTQVLVAMSQEAYTKYVGEMAQDGLLVVDEDLVRLETRGAPALVYAIPATRIAEQELGRKMVANIVMLGCLAALHSAVSAEALQQAVRESVPKGTEAFNIEAFRRGYAYGQGLQQGRNERTQ